MKPTDKELIELDKLARQHEGDFFFRRETPKDQRGIPFEDERNMINIDSVGILVALALIIATFVVVWIFQP